MPDVDFKRTLNTFAKHGASLNSLLPALAQLRSSFSLRLTQRRYNHSGAVAATEIDEANGESESELATSNRADEFSADTECLILLQELLFSDSADPSAGGGGSSSATVCLVGKLHLLLLLQEHADLLVRTQKGLVQLLSFLLDLTNSQQQPARVTAQAMVCCCSLMISHDLLRDEHQLCSKFISHLLDLVGSVNSIHSMLLRFRALQCLIGLEDAYPCLLAKKLDYFYEFCTSEKTYLSEYYYSLFSLLLVHVFDSTTKESGSWSDDRLNSRVESLPAMSLSSIQPLRGRQSLAPVQCPSQSSSAAAATPPGSSPELSRAVGHLIGSLDAGRLSPRAFFAVCRSVGRLLGALGAGGRGLRTAFYRRLPVWDVAVLSALAGLRQQFGLDSLACSDESGCDKLALSMQRVACSPLFATPLRLLMCHCLAAYPHLRVCQGSDTFPEPASGQLVGALFPGVFDPVDLRVLKVRLLSLRFSPRDSSDYEALKDEASACLMGTLVSLSRPAQKSGGRGRHAVAFFASLYAVFARHHASVLGDDIRQMLISMINANLAFAEHLLDFLDCVTQDFPDSDLPYQAYSELCDWVAINSLENASDRQSLCRYMTILNRAAMYSRIPPQPIVDCLVQLAANDDANFSIPNELDNSSGWLCGHLVLDVCRSIFRTHWSRLQSDPIMLASLCGVVAHWAGADARSVDDLCVDVDVRSRAQLYYSLACHMSAQRLASTVFECGPADGEQQQQQTRSTSLAVAAPTASQAMPEMRLLNEPPIELTVLSSGLEAEDEAGNSSAEVALFVPVRLTCRRTPELHEETDLLAVDLTFSTYPETVSVADAAQRANNDPDNSIATVDSVHLPRIRLPPAAAAEADHHSSSSSFNLCLRVVCLRPLPCRLAVRLDCTTGSECRPLTARLSPISLSLADLLRPLSGTPDESLQHSNNGGASAFCSWCPLDRPGASFIRCPPGSAGAASSLARFRLPSAGERVPAKAEANAVSAKEATVKERANTSAALFEVGDCLHYGFRVAANCQLRLALKSLPTAELLAFSVIEDQSGDESTGLSRDAWQLLLQFDRYLKSLFGALENAAVRL